MAKLLEISDWYLKKLMTSDKYFSEKSVKDRDLLVPDFLEKVNIAITTFNKSHSYEVLFVETYRSNSLQQIYFKNGASKIRYKGMHHYGVAIDCAFKIDGEFSYNGDYKLLRQCFHDEGLTLLGLWDMGHVQYISVDEQQNLRATVDNSIRNFQKQNNLLVDGIVGPKTIAKAKELYL